MTLKTWKHACYCLLAIAVVLGAAGCASTGGGAAATAPAGPTDEELIQRMMIDVLAALTAKDVDTMVSYYADDFTSDNGDKAATQAFLEGAKEQGFLEGIVVKTDAMTITVAGETAQVGPVNLEGAFGALALNFGLAKRDSKWLVVSQATQM
ncbi:MAG TPA: hypothetical protein VMS86_00165 [Thermoanaerobaculia bacterium]|nr:hypothetical protein [Thermoanaerobaculia bacterium]